MTRVTQGARQRHFILWFRVDVANLKHSWCLYSRNQTSPKSIIYVDIWIYDCWSTVNLITVHEPMVSLAFTALQRITADDRHNHNTEQPLLLSYKIQTNIIF